MQCFTCQLYLVVVQESDVISNLHFCGVCGVVFGVLGLVVCCFFLIQCISPDGKRKGGIGYTWPYLLSLNTGGAAMKGHTSC